MHYKIPVAKVHKTLNAVKQRQEISFQFSITTKSIIYYISDILIIFKQKHYGKI